MGDGGSIELLFHFNERYRYIPSPVHYLVDGVGSCAACTLAAAGACDSKHGADLKVSPRVRSCHSSCFLIGTTPRTLSFQSIEAHEGAQRHVLVRSAAKMAAFNPRPEQEKFAPAAGRPATD